MKKSKIKSQSKFKWSKRPSELKGFETACYINHDSGDYLRIDYSSSENKSRLYVELKGQSSDSYCIEIINGGILERFSSEKCRPLDIDLVFKNRIKVFNTAPLKNALKDISKVFNIKEYPAKKEKVEIFQPKKDNFSVNSLLVKYKLADFFDFALGILLASSVYFFFGMSYSMSGVVSAVFGVGTGAVDILVRKRKPLFSKVLIFLISGLVLYIYGLMY